ncbi:MAG TPA: riboflavin synthase [Dehalococcoidales bacterium]|nr:riboflavin synthase [Dehalococcoidales bacterium]
MFTGIVEEVGSVVAVSSTALKVAAKKALQNLQLGGSVAVNGACLTAIAFDDKTFSVNVMPETLQKTNLGLLKSGDKVNLERPLGLGGELGGHLVQGHIDGTGKVSAVTPEGAALRIKFTAPPEIMRLIVTKGFICVDGVSLTVTEKDDKFFGVSIVDFTRNNTTLSFKKPGDVVNLEADIIGKYVAEFLKPQGTGITAEFLRENGFPVE